MSNNDTMRGLFFIVKGQYRKGVEPSYVNKETNDLGYIGGYDPYSKETPNWYMLLDCKTFHCIACGGDFKKVLRGVYNTIVKHKGSAKKYFKHVCSVTSEDYYEVHYLGRTPLNHDQRVQKAEGRCPRVSPAMRCLYERIYEEYGDFYSDEIKEMEDLAYSDLVEEKPYNKARKLVSKSKNTKNNVEIVKKEEVVVETPTLKKVKPKVKLGVKKLSMG